MAVSPDYVSRSISVRGETKNPVKTMNWQQRLSIAIMVIGTIGLVLAIVGLASYGAHQNWWSASDLAAKISQDNSIMMMSACAVGGAILSGIGILGFIKNREPEDKTIKSKIEDTENRHSKKSETQEKSKGPIHDEKIANNSGSENTGDEINHIGEDIEKLQSKTRLEKDVLSTLDKLLKPQEFTFALQEDGCYTLVGKHRMGHVKGAEMLEEIEKDIPLDNLKAVCDKYEDADLENYDYVQTSPIKLLDRIISDERLKINLSVNAYTCVRQLNGKYTIVQSRRVSRTTLIILALKTDVESDKLVSKCQHVYTKLAQTAAPPKFIETSPLQPDVLEKIKSNASPK